MKLTKSKLREIIREELLNEKIEDDDILRTYEKICKDVLKSNRFAIADKSLRGEWGILGRMKLSSKPKKYLYINVGELLHYGGKLYYTSYVTKESWTGNVKDFTDIDVDNRIDTHANLPLFNDPKKFKSMFIKKIKKTIKKAKSIL